MAWDKNFPTENTLIRITDDDFREMKSIIKNAISLEHDFETGKHKGGYIQCLKIDDHASLSLGANQIGWAQDENTLYVTDSESNEHSVKKIGSGGVFPSGTKAFFFQDFAPLGWSIYDGSEVDGDQILLIDSSNGGTTGGTWTVTVSKTNHKHSFQIPDHEHEVNIAVRSDAIYKKSSSVTFSSLSFQYKVTASTGMGGSYGREKTGEIEDSYDCWTNEVTIESTTTSWRFPGLYFIIAVRD